MLFLVSNEKYGTLSIYHIKSPYFLHTLLFKPLTKWRFARNLMSHDVNKRVSKLMFSICFFFFLPSSGNLEPTVLTVIPPCFSFNLCYGQPVIVKILNLLYHAFDIRPLSWRHPRVVVSSFSLRMNWELLLLSKLLLCSGELY